MPDTSALDADGHELTVDSADGNLFCARSGQVIPPDDGADQCIDRGRVWWYDAEFLLGR